MTPGRVALPIQYIRYRRIGEAWLFTRSYKIVLDTVSMAIRMAQTKYTIRPNRRSLIIYPGSHCENQFLISIRAAFTVRAGKMEKIWNGAKHIFQ